MSRLNYYAQSGHCYPILIEKHEGKVVAQMRAIMWSNDYLRVNNRFIQMLKEPLKDGIKILFKARIEFDPVHGLSLHITDIDPSFTLGDLEKEKAETITRLKEEGLFNRNKELPFPFLPQRIAVISLESSDGYADFVKVLNSNAWKYAFFHHLFPAFLQGEKAIKSITEQLGKIAKIKQHFDVVVIVRGGGGDIGLSYFNHYDLARAVALFPLPVITGIGHSTNLTVTEMVAHHSTYTPSVLADFFIQKFHNISVPVIEAQKAILKGASQRLDDMKSDLRAEVKSFRAASRTMIQVNHNLLGNSCRNIVQTSKYVFKAQKTDLSYTQREISNLLKTQLRFASQKLKDHYYSLGKTVVKHVAGQKHLLNQQNGILNSAPPMILLKQKSEVLFFEKSMKQLDPVNVLKRGFSVTRVNGKAVQKASELKTGDLVQTTLFQGTFDSVIQNIEKD